ncbi:MAG: GlsB/YeaQ/YmgE family stress response membrane protein [Actinomycetota bacterium]|nr:GlsB/YeaQ/YmgE family stress response membrane protein [Actinomycetota bacterium]
MGIIGWIVLGLIAGLIAKAIMPGDDPGGVIVTALLGIVGALLGGFLAAALFDISVNEEFFDLATWVAAIVGALILLALYRVFAGGRVARR